MANFFKENTKKPTNKKVKKHLSVTIEKLDLNGCGVAYFNKKPVFINATLPNEHVDISVEEQRNKYSIAKLLKINKPSQNRVEVKCQHFSNCGGCDLQHLYYSEQLEFKKNKVTQLFSRAGIDQKLVLDLPWQKPIVSLQWGYRRKARIGVQFNKNSQAIIGFRQKSTNKLVTIKTCPVLAAPADSIFLILKELIDQLSVQKSIGHIEVICTENITEDDIIEPKLTLIVRQIRKLSENDRKLWSQYIEKNRWEVIFQEDNNKFSVQESESTTNNLNYLLENGIQINFTHNDFIQINQQVNIAMVNQAIEWLQLKSSDNILDLFCGLGNFSLPIAKKVNSVVGVEGVQSMVDKAYANAKFNHVNNCQFFQENLNSEWIEKEWAKKTYNKVLLDPARAGAKIAVEQIIQLNIPTILYISCEPSTLATDSHILLSNGYKIKKIGLIDMFSQTKHVETMILFSL